MHNHNGHSRGVVQHRRVTLMLDLIGAAVLRGGEVRKGMPVSARPSEETTDIDSARGARTSRQNADAESRMRALYETHATGLLRYLLRLTMGNREMAEDLLQEVLLRAWRNIDTLPSEGGGLRPWLFTVARHVAIDAARTRQSRPFEVYLTDIASLSGAGVAGDAVERTVAVQTVRDALPKLTPEHRTVLVELYYRGSTTAEAAARIGIPEGTVKSRTFYALRALGVVIGDG
jgi:RNA polymerase sigma-70 factor, ECF subfamily